MDLNRLNYKYIIIIVIIIIIMFLITSTQLKNKDTFTITSTQLKNKDAFTITTRDCFSLTLYGILIGQLFHRTAEAKNILLNSSWNIINNDVYWKNEKTVGNSNIYYDSNNGIITGLDLNKTYQIDVAFDFYNININERTQWKFEIKQIEFIREWNESQKPMAAYSYQYYDYSLNSFNISTFITKTKSFSLLLTNTRGVDVALLSGIDINALNSNITISLLEMI